MADIELVISISEDSYKATCMGHMLPSDVENVVQGIKNGIPHETVTEFADRCRECGREKVLDKIRAEIIEKAKGTMNDTRAEGLYMALTIVDKYRNEVSK